MQRRDGVVVMCRRRLPDSYSWMPGSRQRWPALVLPNAQAEHMSFHRVSELPSSECPHSRPAGSRSMHALSSTSKSPTIDPSIRSIGLIVLLSTAGLALIFLDSSTFGEFLTNAQPGYVIDPLWRGYSHLFRGAFVLYSTQVSLLFGKNIHSEYSLRSWHPTSPNFANRDQRSRGFCGASSLWNYAAQTQMVFLIGTRAVQPTFGNIDTRLGPFRDDDDSARFSTTQQMDGIIQVLTFTKTFLATSSVGEEGGFDMAKRGHDAGFPCSFRRPFVDPPTPIFGETRV
ncbi:hypothetical protein OF83DRAFT_49348 [Amylostereum chailletii]|nr:hypothetical protein OF83DRAFT_49348 [Amylostereum chailletii]